MSSKVKKVTPSQIRAGKADFPLIGMPLGSPPAAAVTSPNKQKAAFDFPKKFTDDELKERLTPQQYNVTQKAGTDKPGAGDYYKHKEKGDYLCVVCQESLFSSNTKYDSRSGWPSFYDVVSQDKVKLLKDTSMMMPRTEVVCSQCGAHLGHVFNDGPKDETGKRYCINSSSLCFKKNDSSPE